jgi:hypothetical protein
LSVPVSPPRSRCRIEAFLRAADLPLTAFCACELRSPAPFTDAGFIAFNRDYVSTLERRAIFTNDRNPVVRSNFFPEIDPPPAPSFHALRYATPAQPPPLPLSSPAVARRRRAPTPAATRPSVTAKEAPTRSPREPASY